MADWDIKKLRILRTLEELGTVTATAEALHMTPSAVSQQLTGLAKSLGVTLLEAHGRRVRLTGAAQLVLRHAEAVFAQLERADADLLGYLQGEAGTVRVGRSPPPSRPWWCRPSRSCAAPTRAWP
ncbi:LysR family transcriptional regulator [Streptomyces albulus]|nr:LysR family transcriptional regulator [Streptomyces noursei]